VISRNRFRAEGSWFVMMLSQIYDAREYQDTPSVGTNNTDIVAFSPVTVGGENASHGGDACDGGSDAQGFPLHPSLVQTT
jgi:hypothetical protein